ncbi:MAG TPA: YeeE/YedE thiosulfate transporter family protein [Desulfuromonadales bacterium]|nr:YeeE/YedE thiosulfate transporter family protein [Desulfuromonadales bacterium]
MLKKLHERRRVQLLLGLSMGIFFGFFLQKGQVTKYDVIMGQLLLKDFTVVKVILTAIVVGMLGIYPLKRMGLVQLHPKPGSIGSTVVGSLIFGIGFALLGYCPGTAVGAVGQGSLDALFGGVTGILVGAALYSVIYPFVAKFVQDLGFFGEVTLQEVFHVSEVKMVLGMTMFILAFFVLLEIFGF